MNGAHTNNRQTEVRNHNRLGSSGSSILLIVPSSLGYEPLRP
jgi:hypothetical protein